VPGRARPAWWPAAFAWCAAGARLAPRAAGADFRGWAAARPEARMARPVAVTGDTPPARCTGSWRPALPVWSRARLASGSALVPPCAARAAFSPAGAPGDPVDRPTATRAAAAAVVPATANVRRGGFR
jgi:hypothetical protein